MRYIYRSNLIDALESLADYEFQKIAWFENDQNLCYSYHEGVEDTFDDGFNQACDAGEIVFSKKADTALHELEKACDALGYKWFGREKELLESEGMQRVREMAAKCLQLIEESDPAESTVIFLEPGEAPNN